MIIKEMVYLREIYIMGQPNVGKSRLLKELKKDPRFYIPKHITNRPRRRDDDDFYDFKDTSYFFIEEMYFYIGDSYNRYYGVPIKNIDFSKTSTHTYVYNCSIKNLKKLLTKVDTEKMLCVFLNRNFFKVFCNNSDNKYQKEELEYRYCEAKKEEQIIKNYLTDPRVKIYYTDEYTNYEELYNKFISDIENKFYYKKEILVTKDMFYPEKICLLTLFMQYLLFNFKNYPQIKIIESNLKRLCYQYKHINGHRLKLNDILEYKMVFDVVENFCLKKVEFYFLSKRNTNIFKEILKYWTILSKISNTCDQDWNSFLETYILQIQDIIDTVNLQYKDLYISHCDLHYKNILINKNKVYFIDFDEINFAPLLWDLVIYVYRYWNNKVGKLSYEIWEHIIKDLKKYNKHEIKNLIILYVLKIILQKKYLEKIGVLNEDYENEDSWLYWKQDFEFLILL